jgi:hypothetical protein
MNDWTRQERSDAISGDIATDARSPDASDARAHAKDSAQRRRIGIAALVLGAFLMFSGAAMVAAAVL